MWSLQPESLVVLVEVLKQKEYRVLGPKVQDGAIVLGELESAADLPKGWTDKQEAGAYRLTQGPNGLLFGYSVGPQSWKKFLHEPSLSLWTARRDKRGLHVVQPDRKPTQMAFVGVRPCELAAIAIQDRVFMEGQFASEPYRLNRQNLFTIAVNCSHPAETCFCGSLNTGPSAEKGFDLLLTEVCQSGGHFLVVEVGSQKGEEVLSRVPRSQSTEGEIEASTEVTAAAERGISRHLETADLRDILTRNFDNPVWDQVGKKCLSCANCTLVCPTCFCTTIEDVTDLHGENAERTRRWDSCFTNGFSYIHGGSIRASTLARYRQWLTHKFAGWVDQFGRPGCVGCGRCITWCPVGIDITQEAEAIRKSDMLA